MLSFVWVDIKSELSEIFVLWFRRWKLFCDSAWAFQAKLALHGRNVNENAPTNCRNESISSWVIKLGHRNNNRAPHPTLVLFIFLFLFYDFYPPLILWKKNYTFVSEYIYISHDFRSIVAPQMLILYLFRV